MNCLGRKLGLVLLIINLVQVAFQQQTGLDVVKAVNEESVIQFKQGNNDSPHIQFKETHYQYNPQIDQDYSIVHTVVYPLSSNARQKFIASVPKDSFVNKLNHKNTPNPQTPTKNNSKTQLNQQNSNKDKEIEKKAQQILQKQTIQQEAKLKEEKAIVEEPKKTPSNPAAQKQQINTKGQQKAQPKAKANLFDSLKKQKKDVNVKQTDKSIKFKEHEIAKPLPITTYPYETKNQDKNKKQSTEVKPTAGTDKNNQQKKAQSKSGSPNNSDHKKQTKSSSKEQRNAKEQKKQIVKQIKKEEIQVDANKPSSKPSLNPISQHHQPSKTIPHTPDSIPNTNTRSNNPNTKTPGGNQDSVLNEQFKELTKRLQTPPEKIKKSLEFQTMVRQQIQQSDWKFLIAKILIGLTILVAIYQATCNSQNHQNKVQKGKYSPLGHTQIDTQNSLDDIVPDKRVSSRK